MRSAIAGNGIAFISHYLAADALRDGALQVVLPEFPIPDLWVKATIPERRVNAAAIQALLRQLKHSTLSSGAMMDALHERPTGPLSLKLFVTVRARLLIVTSPACAEVEQNCRFIQAKPEREACYKRQEAALAEKRKQAATREAMPSYSPEQMSAGRRRAQGAAARHLPGLLTIADYLLPQLPARFSANEARPSDASAVWRRAECILTRRA